MGCTLASYVKIDPDRKLRSYLTPREIELVQGSWDIICQDLDATGLLIFQRFLSGEKHLSRLFHKLTTQESSGEYVFEETKMAAHGRIVLEALGSAVESLDDCSQLTEILIAMGERHALYSVEPKMIRLIWSPVSSVLEEKLGTNFTPEVDLAWQHVFDYINSKMTEGIMKWRNMKS